MHQRVMKPRFDRPERRQVRNVTRLLARPLSQGSKPQNQECRRLVKLPPAENAIGLLRNVLDRLYKELEALRGREEYLRGKNFEGVRRDGEERIALGVSTHPPEPLTTLIAVCALVGGRTDSPRMHKLLEKLHPSMPVEIREPMLSREAEFRSRRPDPVAVDMARLDKAIQGLRLQAAHLATIVRGGRVGAGAPQPEIATRYHAVAERVASLHKQGLPAAEIAQDINSCYEGEWFEKSFTDDEIQ
jgi:hypothetical protein